MNEQALKLKSIEYRKTVLTIIHRANAGHTGGSLSCVDILNVLYNRVMNVSPDNFNDPDHDRYIQSKGHSVEALYTVLADKGFFPREELDTLGQYRSHFIGHPTRKVPGVEQNTGALGHGLSVAVGMALASLTGAAIASSPCWRRRAYRGLKLGSGHDRCALQARQPRRNRRP